MGWRSISTLPELLKKFRDVFDDSQKDVSKGTGLEAPSISFYENGSRFPPVDKLIDLLNYFGVEIHLVSDFGTWKMKSSSKSGERMRLYYSEKDSTNVFRGLPEDEVEDIYSLIKRRRERHED